MHPDGVPAEPFCIIIVWAFTLFSTLRGERTLSQPHTEHEIELERLASIVESSDDAIISKSLDGIVRTWNNGAMKIFGYSPDEIIGQPILKLIPPHLHSEETEILSKLRRGERIDHFDTVRVAKDGRLIDISLTVSPLRNRNGDIVGASKVARDVTDRKRAETLQKLLMDELNHRVKNTLAIVQSVANQSLSFADNPEEFLQTFSGRLQALSRAHDLLVRERMQGIRLRELIEAQISLDATMREAVTITGPDVTIRGSLVTHLALIVHELTTNARKYGALSRDDGHLSITWERQPEIADGLRMTWQESGVPGTDAPETPGFGTQLIEKTLHANGGSGRIDYQPDGIRAIIEFKVQDKDDIAASTGERQTAPSSTPAVPVTAFDGLKALLVEDEAIVAMDIELKLEQLGFEIVGTASSTREARELLARTAPDIALLDANLHGERVDAVAEALSNRAIPFAFATGYGREALPDGFRDHEVLSKPFSDARLVNVLSRLAGRALADREQRQSTSSKASLA